METVSISVVEPTQSVTISVVTGFATVVNSDNSYSLNAPVGATSTLPDITVTDSDGSTFTQPAVTDVVCSAPVGSDVENSDASYTAHVNNGVTLVLPDTTIKNTNGTAVLVQPSCTNTGVISDSIVSNGDNSYVQSLPAETNLILPDITVTEPDSTTYIYPASKDITLPDNRNLNVQFLATYDDNITFTATADEATTWTTESLTNIATIAYEKNGGAASLPITLDASDTLKITITRTNAALDSKVKLTNA